MLHEDLVSSVFQRACEALGERGITFRVMQRRAPVNTLKNYSLGYINLKTRTIALDIFTAKKREPKKISSLLNVIAHEIAHLQKPPYKQFYRFRWINRQHYPAFYRQVKKNLAKLKDDACLKQWFS